MSAEHRPDADDDAITEHLLRTYPVITVVGASTDPAKAANSVPAGMQAHGWRIIPVNPSATRILGEPVFARLADIEEPVGLVDVFRPSASTPDVARQAVAAGAKALWLQLGITSVEAGEIATSAGLTYVENRCLIIERNRLGLDAPTAIPGSDLAPG
jgi:predicted CoA-binding protein